MQIRNSTEIPGAALQQTDVRSKPNFSPCPPLSHNAAIFSFSQMMICINPSWNAVAGVMLFPNFMLIGKVTFGRLNGFEVTALFKKQRRVGPCKAMCAHAHWCASRPAWEIPGAQQDLFLSAFWRCVKRRFFFFKLKG